MTQETPRNHDHSSRGSGGKHISPESVSADELNNVLVANPDATDIGAEIMRLHDDEAVKGDVIYVPPGEYRNQETTIDLTKKITVRSEGSALNPRCKIAKQSDIPAAKIRERYAEISGINFEGADVSDASVGVEVNDRSILNVTANNHGSHGIYENQDGSGGDLNRADINANVFRNGGDGYRTENTSGNAVDMNAGIRNIYNCFGNAGAGLNVVSGQSLIINLAISNQNGGYGFDIAGDRITLNAGRLENNNGSSNSSSRVSGKENIISTAQKGRIDRPNFPNKNQIRYVNYSDGTVGFVPPSVSDTNRPSGNITKEGTIVYNSSDGQLNVLDPGGWSLPDGSST